MNTQDKSIEELENEYWEDSSFDSYVVQTSQRARKKPLSALSKEEIRMSEEDWEQNRADLECFRAIIGENLPLIRTSPEIPIKLLQKYKINLF